jgi:hypothetical protein
MEELTELPLDIEKLRAIGDGLRSVDEYEKNTQLMIVSTNQMREKLAQIKRDF